MTSESDRLNPLEEAYRKFENTMKHLEDEQEALIKGARAMHDQENVEKVRREIKRNKKT